MPRSSRTSALAGTIVALTLAACASSARPSPVSPGIRIGAPSGVSVRAPHEPDWFAVEVDASHLVLGRRTSAGSYVARVMIYGLPEVPTAEAFLAYVSEGRRRDTDPARFVLLEDDVVLDGARQTDCVRYRTTAEDRAASVGAGRTAIVIMEVSGYHCRHPRRPSMAVNAEYSHRHRPDEGDPAFADKAQRFLEGIVFVDF